MEALKEFFCDPEENKKEKEKEKDVEEEDEEVCYHPHNEFFDMSSYCLETGESEVKEYDRYINQQVDYFMLAVRERLGEVVFEPVTKNLLTYFSSAGFVFGGERLEGHFSLANVLRTLVEKATCLLIDTEIIVDAELPSVLPSAVCWNFLDNYSVYKDGVPVVVAGQGDHVVANFRPVYGELSFVARFFTGFKWYAYHFTSTGIFKIDSDVPAVYEGGEADLVLISQISPRTSVKYSYPVRSEFKPSDDKIAACVDGMEVYFFQNKNVRLTANYDSSTDVTTFVDACTNIVTVQNGEFKGNFIVGESGLILPTHLDAHKSEQIKQIMAMPRPSNLMSLGSQKFSVPIRLNLSGTRPVSRYMLGARRSNCHFPNVMSNFLRTRDKVLDLGEFEYELFKKRKVTILATRMYCVRWAKRKQLHKVLVRVPVLFRSNYLSKLFGLKFDLADRIMYGCMYAEFFPLLPSLLKLEENIRLDGVFKWRRKFRSVEDRF